MFIILLAVTSIALLFLVAKLHRELEIERQERAEAEFDMIRKNAALRRKLMRQRKSLFQLNLRQVQSRKTEQRLRSELRDAYANLEMVLDEPRFPAVGHNPRFDRDLLFSLNAPSTEAVDQFRDLIHLGTVHHTDSLKNSFKDLQLFSIDNDN